MAVITLFKGENLPKHSNSPLGNLPLLFGTWIVTEQSLVGPKGVLNGKTLTRKETYRGEVFAKQVLLLQGPFSPSPGNEVVFGFDDDDSALTITRAQPGNETVFLKPSSKFRLYSREENVSISTATENLDVDFKVCVPLPVLNMRYIDEDLHIRRQLTVELTGNGRMFQCEVLYDKLKNTVTELSSSLTKVSNNAIPMYKMIAQEPTLTLNVGEKIGTVKPRKQNCCTKCGNLSKGHLGPTGKLCNMNKC